MIFVILAGIAETSMMIYSLATRSWQEKTRSLVHIAEFTLFAGLAAAAVIPWTFRWYGLAALLAVLLVRGLFVLTQPGKKTAGFKAGKVVVRAVGTTLLVCVCTVPALIFPPHQPLPVSGPHPIDTVRYTYTDELRLEQYTGNGENRAVNVVFWYPRLSDRQETYPLIVFSHGGLGLETSNESLYRELASQGYVVCSIGHPYHAFWTRSEDGRLTFVNGQYFQDLQREDAKTDKPQSYRYYQAWMEIRTADINFVLDTILSKAAAGAGGVYSLVDTGQIGLIGHSLGGSAVLAVPRQRNDVDAVIALESPFLYDITGVENNKFTWIDQDYPVPVLNIYSDSAWTHLSEWPQYARNAALLNDPPAGAVSLYLPGGGHFSLTDLSLSSPLLVRILEGQAPIRDSAEYLLELNRICLEFFNTHLKPHQTLPPEL